MKKLIFSVTLLAFCALPAFGQALRKDLLMNYTQAAELAIGVADAMPAEKYDFRPVKEVFTFGEQITHLAARYVVMMSWATGKPEPPDGMDVFKKLKTKAEIMTAFRQAVTDSQAALGKMTDRQLLGLVATPFFGKTSRANVVMLLSGHTNRHYGQVVIYLRLNGIVPPLSREQ